MYWIENERTFAVVSYLLRIASDGLVKPGFLPGKYR